MAYRKRSIAPTMLGIFNLLVGTINVLHYACGGVVTVFLFSFFASFFSRLPRGHRGREELEQIWASLTDYVPGLTIYFAATYLVGFLLAVFLIVAGFGLIAVRSWARWMSIVVGLFMIAMQLGVMAYHFAVVNPGMVTFQQQMQARYPRAFQKSNPLNVVANSAGVVAKGAFELIYGTLLVVVLAIPNVAEAFSKRPRNRRRWPDYDDYDDY